MARLLALLGWLWAGASMGMPGVGERLPELVGQDITGTTRRLAEFRGARLLVVVITERGASEQMERWLRAAERAIPQVRAVAVVSIRLPPLVSVGYARARAKERVPQEQWPYTWLDRDGKMGRALGLRRSAVPFVFALDEQGRIIATAHEQHSELVAHWIWDSLQPAAP